jgi:predicted nucleic acid-binding protein
MAQVKTVLDATVLVDILRGFPAARAFAEGLDAQPACSEVTRAEIIRGLRPSERPASERLFAVLEWIPVDEAVARKAGELAQKWDRSHPGISMADLLVASTTDLLEARLATANVRHFPMFRGLRPPY